MSNIYWQFDVSLNRLNSTFCEIYRPFAIEMKVIFIEIRINI